MRDQAAKNGPLVTTVVRDASRHGGGMLGVALPLHRELLQRGTKGTFISGNAPAEAVPSAWTVGLSGQGLRALPDSAFGDVVHIHGIWTPFEYRAAQEARRRGARLVMSPHGSLEPWAFRHRWLKKRLAWWLYQRKVLDTADLLIVNSMQERDTLRELGLRSPIATIANGVDMRGFDLEAASDPTPRPRVVLFFARLDTKKGVPDLIDAWSRISDRKGHVLHIQGHGEPAYVREIAELIERRGLGSEVRLLDPAFGKARWGAFMGASLYVLPSYSENFAITVAEALMAGLPVITTRATPWHDIAREGIGWIVDNDVGQLSAALHDALALDGEELLQRRRRGQQYALQRFRWEHIAEQYARTYTWLAGRNAVKPEWIG